MKKTKIKLKLKLKAKDPLEGCYQNAIVTLSDGSTHVFTGRAFGGEGETRRIVNISFTLPKPLPPGSVFDEMDPT